MFAEQTQGAVLFLFSVAVGAALGCFYDILRLAVLSLPGARPVSNGQKRRLTGNARAIEAAMYPVNGRLGVADVVGFICDIAFFAVSAFAVIVLLFHLNYGRVRVFSLVSAVAGYAVYRKTVGRPVTALLKKLVALIKKVTVAVVRITVLPILKLILRLMRPIVTGIRRKRAKRRAIGILSLMQEKEDQRRKKRNVYNERDRSAPDNGKGKRAVPKSKRNSAKGHGRVHKKSLRGRA